MDSIARNQYPAVVWREGEKYLWNPIHRKALKNRPEERVRLRIVEYLTGAGWSRHRITTEEAIKDYTEAGLRTDIICYSQSFEPQILVECKAENILLSSKTAEQVARYNRQVQAPYLLMSNGIQDYWYHLDMDTSTSDQTVKPLEVIPPILKARQNQSESRCVRNFSYWNQRGFAGAKAEPSMRKWLEPVLNQFSVPANTGSIRYLYFKKSPPDLDLNHYYAVTSFGEQDQKMALSFMNTPYGGSRLVGILNQGGKNKGVAEINLDLIFKGQQPNASLYTAEGIETIDFKKNAAELFDDGACSGLHKLSTSLLNLFDF